MIDDLRAMTDDELSKHAMTLSKWRWCPGMSGTFTIDGDRAFFRVFMNHHRSRLGVFSALLSTPHVLEHFLTCYPDARPDLADPATLGCLRSIIEQRSSQRALAEVLVMVMELSTFDDDDDADTARLISDERGARLQREYASLRAREERLAAERFSAACLVEGLEVGVCVDVKARYIFEVTALSGPCSGRMMRMTAQKMHNEPGALIDRLLGRRSCVGRVVE